MIFPPLFSLSKNNKIILWKIKTINALVFIEFGYRDGKMIKYLPTKYKSKEKAISTATRIWTNKKKKGYTENIMKNKIKILPMLAHKYNDHKHKIIYPAIAQPKLDGVRGLAHIQNNKIIIYSRSNNIFKYLINIKNSIKKLNIKKNIYLDGEIFTFAVDPKQIKGAVNIKHKTEENSKILEKLQFHIYDLININDLDMTYDRRYALLKTIVKPNKYLKIVESKIINSHNDVKKYHDYYVKKGYEGLILRNIKAKYDINKRSYNLQKYKEFKDDEFKIIGYKSGKGSDKDTVIWKCKSKISNNTFFVRQEGSREFRKKLLKNVDKYIGKYLTVKYQSIGETGIPLHPVGIAIRNYE